MTLLAPDQRVGAYRIISELGRGGMGTVYRAVHTLLDRPAAIKVLHPEFGHYPTVVERFLNEARATTAIRHPGIVEIYDYGHTESGRAYIAMELLVGATLAERIARTGRIPVADALLLARRITAPLAVAHERGVVHRDLKPDNVFLIADPEGGRLDNVKLLDFGIAKLEGAASSHTTIGVMLGTPAYMSPEQCRGAAECDHRTDLYALGCVMFEMISGQTPFGGRDASAADLIAAHIQRPAPSVETVAAVPDGVARLIARLLAKAPADRPTHAAVVIAELDRLLAAIAPRAAPSRRRSPRAVLAGVSLALLGGLGLWLRTGSGPNAIDAPPDLAWPATEATGEIRIAGRVAEGPAPAAPLHLPEHEDRARTGAPPDAAPEVDVVLSHARPVGVDTPVP